MSWKQIEEEIQDFEQQLIDKIKTRWPDKTDEQAREILEKLKAQVSKEIKEEEMKANGEFYMSLEELDKHSPSIAELSEFIGLNNGDKFKSILDDKYYYIVQEVDDNTFIVKNITAEEF